MEFTTLVILLIAVDVYLYIDLRNTIKRLEDAAKREKYWREKYEKAREQQSSWD